MIPLEVWMPNHNSTGTQGDAEIPTVQEARCYQLYRLEQMTQPAIAELLRLTQPTVSRCIARCETKIEALVKTGRFDRDEIDRTLRKLTGTAPRNAALQKNLVESRSQ